MTDLTPTPTTAKAFADLTRFPGEDAAQALHRRVTMHEYLMTGGIRIEGKKGEPVTYGPEITIHDLAKGEFSDCPFHPGEECSAWAEIRAGDGFWTKMEFELDALENDMESNGDMAGQDRYRELAEQLTLRPKQVPRERQPKFTPRVPQDHALSRKVAKQGGRKPFPWSKEGETVRPMHQSYKPSDTADVARASLTATTASDTITFDDNEGDEE